jgi:Fe-S cluster biogenesis protein NfuA
VPFLRWEYLNAWWQNRGGGEWPDSAVLKVVTARRAGQLVGIAPLFAAAKAAAVVVDDPEDAEIVAQIIELLDTRIRPQVAGDGGDIVYRGFNKGTVFLEMQGACSGCPSSTATLKMGIESLLKYYVPEVTDVRAIQG